MKTTLQAWPKTLLIVMTTIVVSTLGIQAADLTQGISGRLSGLVFTSDGGPCASGEVFWRSGEKAICIDAYEASPRANCPVTNITNAFDTSSNVQSDCTVVSEAGREPWRFVAYAQAQQLCARAGKRLPSNTEWHAVALSLSPSADCVTDSETGSIEPTGTATCMTPGGVYDLVGNVWEWTADTVQDGSYDERVLPLSGYVDLVDQGGVVVRTRSEANRDFGSDYASINNEGLRGILRGGFYQSGEDAGIFAQNASVALDFNGAGVGFRCVRDVQ